MSSKGSLRPATHNSQLLQFYFGKKQKENQQFLRFGSLITYHDGPYVIFQLFNSAKQQKNI